MFFLCNDQLQHVLRALNVAAVCRIPWIGSDPSSGVSIFFDIFIAKIKTIHYKRQTLC